MVKKTTAVLVVLVIALVLGWGSSAMMFIRWLKRMEASYESDVDYWKTEYYELLKSYREMYREWATPPEEIPETEEGREQLALDIVYAGHQKYVDRGECVPLYNLTGHAQHVSGFWYQVQYEGTDEEGRTHHSVLIYVNIATAETFGVLIARANVFSPN